MAAYKLAAQKSRPIKSLLSNSRCFREIRCEKRTSKLRPTCVAAAKAGSVASEDISIFWLCRYRLNHGTCHRCNGQQLLHARLRSSTHKYGDLIAAHPPVTSPIVTIIAAVCRQFRTTIDAPVSTISTVSLLIHGACYPQRYIF